MAKDKNKNKNYEALHTDQIIDRVEKAINKHGKIKIKGDKKATKNLKAMCVHNIHKKNGKLNPTLAKDGDRGFRCTICGAKFTGIPYSDEKIRETISDTVELLNHTEFMIMRVKGKKMDQAIQKITQAKVALLGMDDVAINARVVAAKKNKDGNGKNKGNKNMSSTLSSWMPNR